MARKLVFDHLDPASVIYCVNAARENARQVREEISTEQWQRLNRLFHQIHSPHAQAQFASSISDTLASVIDGIYLFKGTPTHHDSRPGLAVYPPGPLSGARLRHRHAARGLSARSFPARSRERAGYQYLELVGLLRCCTAFEAYCQVYTADLSPDRMLEFLLLNRDFPTPSATALTASGTRSGHPAHGRTPCTGRSHRRHGPAARHARLHHHRRDPFRRSGRVSAHDPRAVPAHSRTLYRHYVHYLDPIRAGR